MSFGALLIAIILHNWLVRNWNFLGYQSVPVNVGEPPVFLYVLSSVFEISVPFTQVSH